MTTEISEPCNKTFDESKQHTRKIFIDQRSGAHGPGAPMETYITKGIVKRQNSMKEDSGVKEQYSRTSIFERICQHCTTHEQTAFTLNHYHTTTSDNSRLPENMPRPCTRVLFG